MKLAKRVRVRAGPRDLDVGQKIAWYAEQHRIPKAEAIWRLVRAGLDSLEEVTPRKPSGGKRGGGASRA